MPGPSKKFLEADNSGLEKNLRFVKSDLEENLNQYFAGSASSSHGNDSIAPPREYKVVQPTPGERYSGQFSKRNDAYTRDNNNKIFSFGYNGNKRNGDHEKKSSNSYRNEINEKKYYDGQSEFHHSSGNLRNDYSNDSLATRECFTSNYHNNDVSRNYQQQSSNERGRYQSSNELYEGKGRGNVYEKDVRGIRNEFSHADRAPNPPRYESQHEAPSGDSCLPRFKINDPSASGEARFVYHHEPNDNFEIRFTNHPEPKLDLENNSRFVQRPLNETFQHNIAQHDSFVQYQNKVNDNEFMYGGNRQMATNEGYTYAQEQSWNPNNNGENKTEGYWQQYSGETRNDTSNAAREHHGYESKKRFSRHNDGEEYGRYRNDSPRRNERYGDNYAKKSRRENYSNERDERHREYERRSTSRNERQRSPDRDDLRHRLNRHSPSNQYKSHNPRGRARGRGTHTQFVGNRAPYRGNSRSNSRHNNDDYDDDREMNRRVRVKSPEPYHRADRTEHYESKNRYFNRNEERREVRNSPHRTAAPERYSFRGKGPRPITHNTYVTPGRKRMHQNNEVNEHLLPMKRYKNPKQDPKKYWSKWWSKFAYVEKAIEILNVSDSDVKSSLTFQCDFTDLGLDEKVQGILTSGTEIIQRHTNINEGNYKFRDAYRVLKHKKLLEDSNFQSCLLPKELAELKEILHIVNQRPMLTFLYQSIICRWDYLMNWLTEAKSNVDDIKTQEAHHLVKHKPFLYLVADAIKKLKKICSEDWDGFEEFYKTLK